MQEPAETVPSACNAQLPSVHARRLPGCTSKKRSRVGVEGGRRSSERLGYSQQCLRDVKGADHRRHVVQHWGAATLEQRGSGVLEHTYPLADPQGVCRLHEERHKDKRRRAVTVDSGRQGQRGPDR